MSMDLSLFKVTPPTPKVVKGWILRAGRTAAPVYWNGQNAIDAWGPDHTVAIRFYRQLDAQRMQSMMGLYLGQVIPYEWDEVAERPTTPVDYAVYVVENK